MTYSIRPALALCFIVMAMDSVSAQNFDRRETNAFNNLHHEMITCIAYFTIFRQCMVNREDPSDKPSVARLDASIKHLMDYSFKVGESIGMTVDAMSARMKSDTAQMIEITRGDCVNVASITDRHLKRCKQVSEDADSVFLEYLNRKPDAR